MEAIDKIDLKYPFYGFRRIRNELRIWEMDITYIPMAHGFMYLAALIDVHSRFVLAWDISNTMTAHWCKEIAANAIAKYGAPEIFNTDQGCQFTSSVFTDYLLENHIKVSMDGKGRAIDNVFIERLWRSVKQEHIYLNVYENGQELYAGLKEYFEFYNHKRPHQSLDYSFTFITGLLLLVNLFLVKDFVYFCRNFFDNFYETL